MLKEQVPVQGFQEEAGVDNLLAVWEVARSSQEEVGASLVKLRLQLCPPKFQGNLACSMAKRK